MNKCGRVGGWACKFRTGDSASEIKISLVYARVTRTLP